MFINFKLYFKYILTNTKYTFIDNLTAKTKNINVFLNKDSLFYLSLHLKLSTPFYLSQLVDIFAYEVALPNYQQTSKNSLHLNSKENSTITVYNFHNLQTCDRFFLFTTGGYRNSKSLKGSGTSNLFSITELFPAANWLEREVSELHGVSFLGKQDLRNLLLQYGDSSAPFQKSFPTIGLQEMYYDPIKDTLIQSPVSVQL